MLSALHFNAIESKANGDVQNAELLEEFYDGLLQIMKDYCLIDFSYHAILVQKNIHSVLAIAIRIAEHRYKDVEEYQEYIREIIAGLEEHKVHGIGLESFRTYLDIMGYNNIALNENEIAFGEQFRGITNVEDLYKYGAFGPRGGVFYRKCKNADIEDLLMIQAFSQTFFLTSYFRGFGPETMYRLNMLIAANDLKFAEPTDFDCIGILAEHRVINKSLAIRLAKNGIYKISRFKGMSINRARKLILKDLTDDSEEEYRKFIYFLKENNIYLTNR